MRDLNRYNVISGMATLENYAVAKAIAVAIGVGAIIIAIEIGLGFASFHLKPLMLGGIALGGLIFGTGMAILGYCPGTLAISLGEGSIDALIGIAGGFDRWFNLHFSITSNPNSSWSQPWQHFPFSLHRAKPFSFLSDRYRDRSGFYMGCIYL